MPSSLGATLSTIYAVLLGYGLIQAGNTLQGTLLAVRGGVEGFGPTVVGFVSAAFWAGVVIGSLRAGHLIRRVGHIRTFAALAAVAATAALMHLLVLHPLAWIAIRGATGFCFAGLFIAVESWLNAEATAGTRGRILSLYGMTGLLAGISGQLLLPSVDVRGFAAFCVISVLISLALVPVALSRVSAPANAVGETHINMAKLYRASPFGFVAAILCGFSTASFFSLAPVLLQSAGLAPPHIASFMASATLGGFLMSWPMGRLSDGIDRRIVAVSMAATGTAVVLGIINLMPDNPGIAMLCSAAALFGACVMPTYGVVVAHVNDNVPPGAYVAASGGLLVLQGIGSSLGPIISGMAMSAAGGYGLGLSIASALAIVAVYGLIRMTRRAAPTAEEKSTFSLAPSVPVSAALHPAVPVMVELGGPAQDNLARGGTRTPAGARA